MLMMMISFCKSLAAISSISGKVSWHSANKQMINKKVKKYVNAINT